MSKIVEKLDRLADLQSHFDVINLQFDKLREDVLTPEIKAKLEDIEAERETTLESVQGGMESLEAEIKDAVVLQGATVKGKFLQAVWSKPRVTWDTKALEGYAAGHPEIMPFRKEGKPSVSIRGVV